MTVTAVGFSGPTWVQYPANGAATVFNIPFLITAATDLAVGFILGGVYTQQSAGFTLQVVYPGLGTITFATAPPSGTTVDLRSQIPETQPTNFSNLGGYYPENTTNSVDRITRLVTDLYRLAYQFGVHGPDQENTPWNALPNAAVRANGLLAFDANGLPTIGVQNSGSLLTQTQFNGFLLLAPTGGTQTQAEALASVVPVNYAATPGHVERYFVNSSPGSTDATAGFNAAIAQAKQIGGASVFIGTQLALASSVTIPSGVSLQFNAAGSVNIANGMVLTLNGEILGPRIPVFTGSGTVVLGPGCCLEAYPEWWGAVPNATASGAGTDCTAAMIAAITACSGGSLILGIGVGVIPLRLAAGYYLCSNLVLTPAFTLRGAGRKSSGFVAATGTSGIWLTDNGNAAGIILEDFAMYGVSANNPNMTNLINMGYGSSPHGSEGYFKGLWPRDCACSGGAFAVDIKGNIGFYNLISIYGATTPAAGQSLLRIIGAGNQWSNTIVIGAGANAYSVYINAPGSVINQMEIESPASCSSSFAPLSIQANCFINGCIISLNNSAPTTFDHLVEVGANASSWSIQGLELFNGAGFGSVSGGNIYNIPMTSYFGGSITTSGQGTGSYTSGIANVLSGTATFAGNTALAISLPWGQTVSNYKVNLQPGGASPPAYWWSSKTPNGFVINFASAYTGSVDWSVTL